MVIWLCPSVCPWPLGPGAWTWHQQAIIKFTHDVSMNREVGLSGELLMATMQGIVLSNSSQGTHCTRKTGKIAPKKSLSGKTQGIWKCCQNTRNLVCSSCKFPNSKDKRYFNIWHGNFLFFSPEAAIVCQVSFVYVIVTNHREIWCLDTEKQRKHREFENAIWVGTLSSVKE